MKRWKQKVISVILALCLLIPSAGLTVAAGEEGKLNCRKRFLTHRQAEVQTILLLRKENGRQEMTCIHGQLW